MNRRRQVRFLVLVALPTLALVTGVWWWKREPAANPLERWCADQLRRVAGDLLAPTLEFGSLQLELPATVTLGQLSGERPTVNGSGLLAVVDGRLIHIPLLGALGQRLNARGVEEDRGDRARVEFTLAIDRATIEESEIESRLFAARATGDIHYDSRLGLNVSAGIIEKAQSLLGGLGDVLGALTDRLVYYHVSGTWSEPVVTPAALGFAPGKEPDEEQEQ
jgi:hypothetical protein